MIERISLNRRELTKKGHHHAHQLISCQRVLEFVHALELFYLSDIAPSPEWIEHPTLGHLFRSSGLRVEKVLRNCFQRQGSRLVINCRLDQTQTVIADIEIRDNKKNGLFHLQVEVYGLILKTIDSRY